MFILTAKRNNYRKYLSVPTKMFISYIQGQSPQPKVREYFYFIDHQGMLFLDDSKMKNFTSCFKEKKFLEFFFKRLRINDTGRYMEDFPYLSICGRERNFIRCDDLPIVFTHVIKKTIDNQTENHLSYAYTGDLLTMKFQPDAIYMNPENGRVYHPAPEKYGGIGLIRSKLAIEFSKYFEFNKKDNDIPEFFTWDNEKYKLNHDWYHQLLKKNKN